MKKAVFVFLAFSMVAAWNISAIGSTDQEQRIKSLEQRLKALEGELQQLKKDTQTKKGSKETFRKKAVKPSFTFRKNDYFLCTEDEQFWMKIRGNLHFDSKFYGGNSNNPTEFDVRRVRIDFQGMWYKSCLSG